MGNWGSGADELRELVRAVVREEIKRLAYDPTFSVQGMEYKPLYKMKEVCKLFEVSRQTIYEWIKIGKLRPVKVRSRVYFLWKDLEELIKTENVNEIDEWIG